jgi:hypothetical protein
MHWRGIDLGHVTLTTLARNGESGRCWYADSRHEIEGYSASHGFDPGVVSDVLAILSPRVTVDFSIKLAHRYLHTGQATGAMQSRQRALDTYRSTGVFNGPKVNAFASALRGDPDAVVVDAWMFRAAREQRTTPRAYREVAWAVRQAAHGLGWPAGECQAAIWQGARSFVGYHEGYAPMVMP